MYSCIANVPLIIFQIPLGIVPRNEVKNEEMIEILQHLHRYVPAVSANGENSHLLQIGFAGDQLTAARARQAIDSRVNSKDPFEALRGFVPFACDWHAKVNYLSASVNTHTHPHTHTHTHTHMHTTW